MEVETWKLRQVDERTDWTCLRRPTCRESEVERDRLPSRKQDKCRSCQAARRRLGNRRLGKDKKQTTFAP